MPRRENRFSERRQQSGFATRSAGAGFLRHCERLGQACKNLDARTLDLRLAKGLIGGRTRLGWREPGAAISNRLPTGRRGPASHRSRRSAAHGCYRFGLCDVRVFFYTVQPFIHQGPEKRFLFDR